MTFSLDIATLQQAYADGSLRPEAVITEAYDRITANGVAPVWISLRSRAELLDRVRKAPAGVLHGIPFAVKDNIDVAGLPTTCACPAFAYVPETNAAVVDRLEAAGAISIGKTNMDQFATGLVGTRSPYGIPASVFSAEHISGGSSSGSGVAVAAGLVSFALGTDTAGSGRVPAAFNNIVGLKPTKGMLSARGVVPACRTQDTVSIFALTTGDAMRVYDVAAAFDSEDAFSRPLPRRGSRSSEGPIVRLGVPAATLDFCGDAAAHRMYTEAIKRAERLGFTVVRFDFSPFAEAARLLYQGPWVAERLAAIKDFAQASAAELHPVVASIILGSASLKATDVFDGVYRLAELERLAQNAWRDMDAMLLPTTPTTYRIEDVLRDPVRLNANLGLYTNFVNLMDLSALAVPAGFRDDGLPSGVTLIAPACSESLLASAADQLHRAIEDLPLGNTATRLASTPTFARVPQGRRVVEVAVVGAHLTGQPLNSQLVERGARLLTADRTAPGYSLYALRNTTPLKPGLVFDGTGAGNIEVEVWEMGEAEFGSFVALIPAPLGIGTLTLADGRQTKGFVCEAHAVSGSENITAFGGWRAWLQSVESAPVSRTKGP